MSLSLEGGERRGEEEKEGPWEWTGCDSEKQLVKNGKLLFLCVFGSGD